MRGAGCRRGRRTGVTRAECTRPVSGGSALPAAARVSGLAAGRDGVYSDVLTRTTRQIRQVGVDGPARFVTGSPLAEVAELADALASGASDRKVMKVRVLSSAPSSRRTLLAVHFRTTERPLPGPRFGTRSSPVSRRCSASDSSGSQGGFRRVDATRCPRHREHRPSTAKT